MPFPPVMRCETCKNWTPETGVCTAMIPSLAPDKPNPCALNGAPVTTPATFGCSLWFTKKAPTPMVVPAIPQ